MLWLLIQLLTAPYLIKCQDLLKIVRKADGDEILLVNDVNITLSKCLYIKEAVWRENKCSCKKDFSTFFTFNVTNFGCFNRKSIGTECDLYGEGSSDSIDTIDVTKIAIVDGSNDVRLSTFFASSPPICNNSFSETISLQVWKNHHWEMINASHLTAEDNTGRLFKFDRKCSTSTYCMIVKSTGSCVEIASNITQSTEIATNIPQLTEVKILNAKLPLLTKPVSKASSTKVQKSSAETKAVSRLRSVITTSKKTESGLPTTMQLFTNLSGILKLTSTKKESATNPVLPPTKKTTSKAKSSIFTSTNATFTPTNGLQKLSTKTKVNTTSAIILTSTFTEGNKSKKELLSPIQSSIEIEEIKSVSIEPLKLENVDTQPASVFSLEESRLIESFKTDLLNGTLGNFTKNVTIESMADEIVVTATMGKINATITWNSKFFTPLLAIIIIVVLSCLTWLIFFLWKKVVRRGPAQSNEYKNDLENDAFYEVVNPMTNIEDATYLTSSDVVEKKKKSTDKVDTTGRRYRARNEWSRKSKCQEEKPKSGPGEKKGGNCEEPCGSSVQVIEENQCDDDAEQVENIYDSVEEKVYDSRSAPVKEAEEAGVLFLGDFLTTQRIKSISTASLKSFGDLDDSPIVLEDIPSSMSSNCMCDKVSEPDCISEIYDNVFEERVYFETQVEPPSLPPRDLRRFPSLAHKKLDSDENTDTISNIYEVAING